MHVLSRHRDERIVIGDVVIGSVEDVHRDEIIGWIS